MAETGDIGVGHDGAREELGFGFEWRLARLGVAGRMSWGATGTTGQQD
jgi:hypothetical protein